MEAPLFLGIDVGTSATKMGLVTSKGKVLATHTEHNTVVSPHPGWMEMSTERWWAGICRGIPRLCEGASVRSHSIAGVGFSVLYPALIPLDGARRPLRPAILYSDQRSVKQLAWLNRRIGAGKFLRISGNVPSVGTCSLTSLLWVKENEPSTFDRALSFVHANSYLGAQLTGEVATDWSNASLTGLFETAGGFRWSHRLASAAGIPMDKLPRLLSPYENLGAVTRDAARATGLKEGTPVCLGAGDTACSALGVGLVQAGDVSLTCGTTDNLAVCVDAPRFDRRFVTSAHVVPNRWLLIGTMSSTGGALEWSARLLQYAKEATGVPYDDLFAAACEVRAGSEGVIFLPYLQGERSPVWDPAARGVLSGLTLATSPQHLIRAVLEGCAFALRQNVEISEEILGRRIPALKIVGGGTRSDVWNAIKANVLQKPLHRVSMRETSLLGAAMLAAICAGASASPEAAARAMQARISAPPILPDPAHRKIYDSRYRRYLRLYPSLRTVFPISP